MPDLDAGIGLETLGQISCSPIFPLLSLVNSEIKQYFSYLKTEKKFFHSGPLSTHPFSLALILEGFVKVQPFSEVFFFFLSPLTDIRLLQHQGNVYVSHISKSFHIRLMKERKLSLSHCTNSILKTY